MGQPASTQKQRERKTNGSTCVAWPALQPVYCCNTIFVASSLVQYSFFIVATLYLQQAHWSNILFYCCNTIFAASSLGRSCSRHTEWDLQGYKRSVAVQCSSVRFCTTFTTVLSEEAKASYTSSWKNCSNCLSILSLLFHCNRTISTLKKIVSLRIDIECFHAGIWTRVRVC